MPRSVPAEEKLRALNLMLAKDDQGSFINGQREIERETGLSRPYLRKLARSIGHQFPRNGIEIKGQLCMCSNDGVLFRRPKSKVIRARNQFCDELCKRAFMKGPNHPAWKNGKTASTFSNWVKNQKEYKDWREAVLERDGYKCAISGREDNLQAHHIIPKSEAMSPEKAFDVENGITLNQDVHNRVHELIREGVDFDDAIDKVREEYNVKTEIKNESV